MKTTKLLFIAALALTFAACDANLPTKAFVGVWEPIIDEPESGIDDLFIITSDSIKGANRAAHYYCAYKMIRKDVALLDRCWLKDWDQDSHWEDEYVAEAQMYINDEGHLIIIEFDPTMRLHQVTPNYARMELRRHQQ